MIATAKRRLPGRLDRFVGAQRAALEHALASTILVVPVNAAIPLDEFMEWGDAVDAWTAARQKAGFASIVVSYDVTTDMASVRFWEWKDVRRRTVAVTARRMKELVESLRARDLLDEEASLNPDENAPIGAGWATRLMHFAEAMAIAKRFADLDREICWKSNRIVSEVLHS